MTYREMAARRYAVGHPKREASAKENAMRKWITYDILKSIEACSPALAAFYELFPNGATWSETIDAALGVDRQDWAAWFSWYCPPIDGATWAVRLALQRNDEDRAWLGQVCPVIDGATWAVRLALQRNDFDRAELVHWCPLGVKGDPR